MNPACQAQAQQVYIIYAVFTLIITFAIAGFYGWRRTRSPWRTILFVVFAVCTLLVIDGFTLAFVQAFAPATVSSAGSACP